jgi:hypothetical protein
MSADREDNVRDLRQQIEAGEYRVDPTAVADAIVRRLRDIAAAREEIIRQAESTQRDGEQIQNECSYPDSLSSPSVKTTPAGPDTTDPIQVRPTSRSSPLVALADSILRALSGTQTQSS